MTHTDMQPPSLLRPDARSRILTAASEIFLRDGFAGASVDAIAASARMSKLSIYELFPNKSALFEAAVRDSIDRHFFDLPPSMHDASIEECLAFLGHSMFDRFIDPVNFGLFRANIEAANHFPELAAALHLHRRQTSQISAAFLQRWVDNGCLNVPDALLAVIRFSALCIEGSRYLLGTAPPAAEERNAIVLRICALFLDGYCAANTGAAPDWSIAGPPEQPVNVATRMAPDRVEKLLSAAMEEFLTNGYKGASIDRAVAVIKAGKTTVYRQFGSKEGLFRYIIERSIHDEYVKTYHVSQAMSDLHSEIADLARQALDRHCEWHNIKLHRLLIQEADFVSDLATRFYDARANCLGKALTEVLGKYGKPVPDAASVRTFYNLATSALRFLTVATLPDAAQRQDEAAEVTRIFLDGVRS